MSAAVDDMLQWTDRGVGAGGGLLRGGEPAWRVDGGRWSATLLGALAGEAGGSEGSGGFEGSEGSGGSGGSGGWGEPVVLQWPRAWRVVNEGGGAAEELAADGGVLDLAEGRVWSPGAVAEAAARFVAPGDGTLVLHLTADYFARWRLDGELVLDTWDKGNGAGLAEGGRAVAVAVGGGTHELAATVRAGSGGWAVGGELHWYPAGGAVEGASPALVECRWSFEVSDPQPPEAPEPPAPPEAPESPAPPEPPVPPVHPGAGRWLTLEAEAAERWRLNGVALQLPLAGMHYRRLPGVPAALLRAGANELTRAWHGDEAAALARGAALRWLTRSGGARRPVAGASLQWSGAAAVAGGPVVVPGPDGELDVACRTDAPAALTLACGAASWPGAEGLLHRFRVPAAALAGGLVQPFELRDGARVVASGQLRPPPPPSAPRTRLAVCADAGPLPATWAQTAAAIAALRPDAVVFVGDLVNRGRRYDQWDAEFFAPAAPLLRATPLLVCPGNHDEHSPLLPALLLPDPQQRHWLRRLGPLALLGLDGDDELTAPAPAAWLDAALAAAADAPFLLVFHHYPAFSSGPHTRLDPHGQPAEPQVQNAREHLLPLLQRHHATAFISGHDHLYERSHPPAGPTCLVTGGAGAYLYHPRPGHHNPHQAAAAAAHHFLLLDATTDHCSMTALDLHGHPLDSLQWTTRTTTAAAQP